MSKSDVNTPKGPLYDPKGKVQNYVTNEDIDQIRLNVQSKKLGLFTDQTFDYYMADDKDWRRPKEICSNPIFIDGKPDRFDALQGFLEDCWAVVGMEALSSHEQLFNHVVPPDQGFDHNYIGAFHFRIWQLGIWYDVVVDDRLPVFKKNNKVCYARSSARRGDIFWASLLEKAYAKVCSHRPTTYHSLSYGFPSTSFQDFTGGIVEKVNTSDHLNTSSIKWYLNKLFSLDAMISCACKDKVVASTGLMQGHGYTVTGVFKCADDDPDYHGLFLLRILNPWGYKEWTGNWSDNDYNLWRQIDRDIRNKLKVVIREDGEFWMDETDFCRNFDRMWVCHLGPGQYQTSRVSETSKTWKTTFLHGEWVKKVSAGGSSVSNRHKNPQYRISLKLPENDANEDGLCTVVIELTQKDKEARYMLYAIGFYIYLLPKSGNIPMPLDRNFFETNKALNACDFYSMDGPSYVMSTSLEPGEYCIVPCTEEEDKELQFLLRVFSESVVNLWENDTRISKCVKEEESPNESDDGIEMLFNAVTSGHGEIDWVGLKEILEAVMNPNLTCFGIIVSFFKLISNLFSKYVLFQSNEDFWDNAVVFSKDECRSMVAMLDSDRSGKLSFSEFRELWRMIRLWTGIYERHKDEVEGQVKVSYLREALSSIGYDVNKRTVHSLSFIYANEQRNVSLTDFILCGVTLESVLDNREKKSLNNDKIIFNLEEWVKNTLFL